MKPVLWPVFHCRYFNKEVGSVQWLESAFTDVRVLADARDLSDVRFAPILLQKSKVASVRIFGEILKREAIDDSDSLSRVTEVAYEFSVGR